MLKLKIVTRVGKLRFNVLFNETRKLVHKTSNLTIVKVASKGNMSPNFNSISLHVCISSTFVNMQFLFASRQLRSPASYLTSYLCKYFLVISRQ